MAKIDSGIHKSPPQLPVNEDILVFKRIPPMKVTVKFESTSVVVPVTEGMLVSDLIEAAVNRYKKVGNKIVAIFDEQDASSAPPHHAYIFPHNVDCGSLGTTSNSPDFVRSSSTNSSAGSNATSSGGGGGRGSIVNNYIRRFNNSSTPPPPPVPPRFPPNMDGDNNERSSERMKKNRIYNNNSYRKSNADQPHDGHNNSVVVKRLDDIPASSSLLIVRRGSEPALNGQEDVENNVQEVNVEPTPTTATPNRVKWPTHPDLAAEGRSSTDTEDDRNGSGGRVSSSGMGKFVRSGARKSRVTEEMLEMAAQLAEDHHRHSSTHEDDDVYANVDVVSSFSAGQEKHRRFEIRYVTIKCDDDKKLLGLQVLPEYGEIGQLSSLIVKYIQPGTRAAVDGQLKPDDRIVEINDNLVSEMSFVGAQTFLLNASTQNRLCLKIMRRPSLNESSSRTVAATNSSLRKEKERMRSPSPNNQTTTVPFSNLQKANTRKIGRVFTIEIVKSADGLGFTLTSRDNASVGDNFTCIKNILSRGSAIKDGRLKEGDKILEINNVDVTGMGKEKIVSLLRDVKEGQNVKLVVSRQENVESSSLSPVLPRQLPAEKANVESLGSERCKQRLVLDIALNDTGSAGLGVSVKGRTATETLSGCEIRQRDCGIFIKTVLHGGAAHKDGRIKVNDQLIAVNDIDLTNLSNKEAMTQVRTAMQELDPSAYSIKLVVLRTISSASLTNVSSGNLRPSTPPMSPGTPDGAASLLLEMPGCSSPVGSANQRPAHYLVPGYGEYAIVVKDPSSSHAPTLSMGSRPEETLVIEDDDVHKFEVQRQVSSDTKSENSGVEETDYYQSTVDPFVRDAPTRQSMSEKRHGAAKLDPASTLTFQRIKHHRQSSAPSLQDSQNDSNGLVSYKTDPSSFHGTSVLVGGPAAALTNERRSLSLESLGPSTLAAVVQQQQQSSEYYYPSTKPSVERPLIHEQVAQNVLRNSNLHGPPSKIKSKSKLSAAQRARMTNESFRAAVDKSYDENGLEVAVDVGVDGVLLSDVHLDSPIMDGQQGSSSSPRANFVNKDKSRRKSTGSGLSTLKSLFRFGSGGKANKRLGGLAYDEKVVVDHEQQIRYEVELQEKARRHAEEEQRKIRMHYERLKEKEQQKQQHLAGHHRHRSPNKQIQHRVGYPSPMSSNSSQLQPSSPYFNVAAHSKMPSHWKPPPVPPASSCSSTYTPPLPCHQPPSHSMQLRYHSPSDPTQLSSGIGGVYHHRPSRANGQHYAQKNYDTDDGYGELNVAIVETNRCYRSLERPSAHSVGITGVQRSIGVQSRDKPSPKEIGTNSHHPQQQPNRRLVHHSQQHQDQPQRSYGRSAGDDLPNFNGDVGFADNIINNNNNIYHNPKNSKRVVTTTENRNDNKKNNSSSFVLYGGGGEQNMPPIPPPDYDQYLRTTSKPKAPRKIRPASDYIGSHKTTSLPRRPPPPPPSSLTDNAQPTTYYNGRAETAAETTTTYDSYGSLPRNGHYTTVRM